MRLALVVFLALHGLAHLVGFVAPWGQAPRAAAGSPALVKHALFGGRLTLGVFAARAAGILWMLGTLAFGVTAVGVWRESAWAWGALVGVLCCSLILTLHRWPKARIGAAVNVGLLVALTAVAYVQYRRELGWARASVLSRGIVTGTATGPVEFITYGEGTPVLVLHGTAGGWDQGLHASHALARFGFEVIVPSRFGYLRTALPEGATPALEADTWAALLDSLGIRQLPVMAWSAGAAPALQLALRHPQRVSKLVLFVPGTGGVLASGAPGPPAWVLNGILKSDFPLWVARRLSPKTMLDLVAVPASLVPTLDTRDRDVLDESIRQIMPVSQRRRGMMYDARNQSGAEGVYPLEEITVPVLAISAADDLYRTLRVARRLAEIVPGAELLEFATGGHLLLGHADTIWPRVAEFVRR
jgi:2-hydroxy-6-oxonona-2,4-dienedioate hydrolase